MYEYPPVLTGTPSEQLQQLWDYLYQLVEKLNINIDEGSAKNE